MNLFKEASVENIQRGIEELNQFNSTPGEGTTRILFTPEELKARAYIKDRMVKMGLRIREDNVGNIFGTLEGLETSIPPVWTGSHIDTVLNAGRFDGMTGVIGGLEAVRLIKESGLPHQRNIEVIVFTSEEPTRFGKGCLGSRALAGLLSQEEANEIKDEEGLSFLEVLDSLGYKPGQFDKVPVAKNNVHAFVELHIEQGPVLEYKGLPIGIVTTISAPTNMQVTILGQQGHAGGTPMDMRHDALAAASEIFLKLEEMAMGSGPRGIAGTIGKVEVFPNASNVIPGKTCFTIDIRGSEFATKDRIVKELLQFMDEVGERRHVQVITEHINHDIPRDSSKNIIQIIKDACFKYHYPFCEIISGAFHDAMFVAEFAPMGMIFIPCRGGLSHHPEEWAEYSDIAKGVNVLTESLFQLANS